MDISIYENGNGGEFDYQNNDVVLTEGLFNQVYLALFGGNVEQSTTQDMESPRLDWWGNQALLADSPKAQFNSLTERTLREVALTSSGIAQIEQAMAADLAYLGITFTASAFLDGADRLNLSVKLDQEGEGFLFIWDAAKAEVIESKII
jgi:phage gp46-like protein